MIHQYQTRCTQHFCTLTFISFLGARRKLRKVKERFKIVMIYTMHPQFTFFQITVHSIENDFMVYITKSLS